MRMIELQNYSSARISIAPVRGLVFEPGEVKKVHPSTVKHPAVTPYIGNGLKVVNAGAAPQQEPKAPELTTPVVPDVSEPIAATPETSETTDTKLTEESSGQNLRDLYVSGPGITESNVDAILEAYPTLEALKKADKADLIELKVSKNQAKKLIAWVAKQD